MASPAGQNGAAGGLGATSTAVTRIDVIDPHLVVMMRDVMDKTEQASRLKVSGASGGGGGGGGAGSDGFGVGQGQPGQDGETPPASGSCILSADGANGGAGAAGSTATQSGVCDGGPGGGGGGGILPGFSAALGIISMLGAAAAMAGRRKD